MIRAPAIARRELSSYFFSPIAYVAMCVFLVICAFAFSRDFEPGQPVEMRHLFEWMVWVLVVIVPVLCMGLISQEWATGTIEPLMTAPVDETDVILGKFLGSLAFFLVLLAPTLLYVVLLRIYGVPDLGPIVSGYLGIILAGSMFIAVSLFCSSLTRSQVVAAALAVVILFLMTVMPYLAAAQSAKMNDFWQWLLQEAVYRRYNDFARGLIDSSNVVFFVVVTAVFLFLSVKVLESRRWK